MQISITTTHQPATDLGYLLHKHPDKVQTFDTTGGKVHVFYPIANEEICKMVFLLEIDSIDLVRTLKVPSKGSMLKHYVNDRPYTASTFVSSAISNVFSSALNGKCKEKPELVEQIMPFEVSLDVIKINGGEDFCRKIFEPLGYKIELKRYVLDEKFTVWGDSNYYSLKLTGEQKLKDLLSHLYVLLPVFDKERHYWVSKNNIEILLAKGETWLKTHPEKELITHRYLKNIKSLSRIALERLVETEEEEIQSPEEKEMKEKKISLHEQRLEAVLEQLKKSEASTVLDLGCGEGKLLKKLLREKQFQKILGLDVSFRELQKAKEKLYWENMPPKQKERIKLIQGSLTYRDKRLAGYEACAIVEVIEHLELERLPAFERCVFEFAQAQTVIMTTPNAEYNAKYEFLKDNQFRHSDHRFEWTRKEFEDWTNKVCKQFGYKAEIMPIGEIDKVVGASSQMVIFRKWKS